MGRARQDKYMNFPYPPCPFLFLFLIFLIFFKFKYIKINIKLWKKTFSIWSLVLMQYMRYELLLKSNYSLLWEKKYVNDISALVWLPSLIKFWWNQTILLVHSIRYRVLNSEKSTKEIKDNEGNKSLIL